MPKAIPWCIAVLCCLVATAFAEQRPAPPINVLVPPPYGEVRHKHLSVDPPQEYWLYAGRCTGSQEIDTYWLATLRRIWHSTEEYVEFTLVWDHPDLKNMFLYRTNSEQMVWTIDDQEFTTPFHYKLESNKDKGKTHFETRFETRIPLDQFRSLAYSVRSRVQMGDFVLDWYEKDREGMRQFLSHWPRGMAGKFLIETDPEIEAALAEQAAEEAARQAEQRAFAALRGIERHILPRDSDRAYQLLEELIQRYPETPSAKRARELLPPR